MSLQVWLPMTNNTNNQGLGGHTMNGSPASWSNGKIGKCATFTGNTSNVIYNNTTDFNYTDNFSFCLWINQNYTGSSTQWAFTVGRADAGGFGYGIRIHSVNNIVCKFGTKDVSVDCPANEWHHIAFSVSGTVIKTYKDGILYSTTTTATLPTYSGGNGLGIGCFHYGGGNIYPYYGSINDFRIYDHCLSPLEIKQISQGLICNYKLGGVGNENLVKGCYECYLTNTTQNASGNLVFILSSDEMLKLKGKTLVFSYYYSAEGERLAASGGLGNRFGIHGTFNYTNTSGSTIQNYPFAGYLTSSGTGRAVMKWTVPSDIDTINSNLRFAIQTYAKPNTTNNNTWYIKDCKLEIGSDATTWCPAPSDTIYSTLGYNDGIEYDCSGYGNHGTKVGNIAWSGDSARYSGSYYLGGTGYIKNSSFNFIASQMTVALWIKIPATITAQHFLFGTFNKWTGNGIGFWRDLNTMHYKLLYKSDAVSSYVLINTPNLTANIWYHLAVVYTGTDCIVYVNGTESNRITYGSSGTITNPTCYIGNSLYNNFPSSETDESYVSDFRIYATALSDEDIQNLYSVSASIDKTGILSAYEFTEGD